MKKKSNNKGACYTFRGNYNVRTYLSLNILLFKIKSNFLSKSMD